MTVLEVGLGHGKRFKTFRAAMNWLRGRSPRKVGKVLIKDAFSMEDGEVICPSGHTVELRNCIKFSPMKKETTAYGGASVLETAGIPV